MPSWWHPTRYTGRAAACWWKRSAAASPCCRRSSWRDASPGLDLGAIPSAPRPAIVAMAIGCDDPGRVAACLAAGGIAHDRVEGTVRVGAAAAFGAILEFHPEG